jgi:hypothetical protein
MLKRDKPLLNRLHTPFYYASMQLEQTWRGTASYNRPNVCLLNADAWGFDTFLLFWNY